LIEEKANAKQLNEEVDSILLRIDDTVREMRRLRMECEDSTEKIEKQRIKF